MKHLRTLIAATLLALAGAAHADDYAYLTVSQDGDDTSFAVSQIDKITFTDAYMVVHLTTGDTQQLPLAGLRKMAFSATGTASIGSVAAGPARMQLSGGTLRVSTDRATRLVVYDAAGAVVHSTAVGPGQSEVNLSGLRQGVYIVRLGQEARKVMAR